MIWLLFKNIVYATEAWATNKKIKPKGKILAANMEYSRCWQGLRRAENKWVNKVTKWRQTEKIKQRPRRDEVDESMQRKVLEVEYWKIYDNGKPG